LYLEAVDYAFSGMVDYAMLVIYGSDPEGEKRTLLVTPAMAAGVTDRLWDVEDLVAAWQASEGRAERQAA
jgi:hypothetical protein